MFRDSFEIPPPPPSLVADGPTAAALLVMTPAGLFNIKRLILLMRMWTRVRNG